MAPNYDERGSQVPWPGREMGSNERRGELTGPGTEIAAVAVTSGLQILDHSQARDIRSVASYKIFMQ